MSNVKLPVDKDVPIPARMTSGVQLDELSVGDSVLFPIEERTKIANRASYFKIKYGRVFTIRKVNADSCRIWRTV